ncbi:MAG: acyl--CoA ligase [Alphaproteobacteria bacterium]
MTQTIYDLIDAQSDTGIAIAMPASEAGGRPPMSFGRLKKLISDVQADLNALGIGRNDRVAIVLPNGPEMAASFIAIACSATTAPLNPAYGREEMDFYLEDLKAKALVLAEDDDGPAAEAAQAYGIPVIRLTSKGDDPIGIFHLLAEAARAGDRAATTGFAAPADTALILHTSGTTSRPKIVPLSHLNVTASAGHIGQTLRLAPTDRCLNIMPLFHIHGLIAAVLSSLAAGASVWCAPGFNALKAFSWLDEVDPTWYTAVPTMHQALLARAPRNKEIVEKLNLRLIRSSSSSLPPQVMAALEETFSCPVLESYGMTEAAHQMAANPLPPAARKPGAVGIAAGPEVAIMNDAGELLPQGEIGEVVIQGPNVTKGYENNDEANATAFTNGWFRTGDQGALDEEGYLRLTGRLKEIINRGGEKISPLEVDEVIMDHPAVAQCVTFAMPHKSLGEDVAAAVVLKEGQTADEAEIRKFVQSRIADFKAPRKVIVLDEIPKGATGKLQRIGLAEKLGLG